MIWEVKHNIWFYFNFVNIYHFKILWHFHFYSYLSFYRITYLFDTQSLMMLLMLLYIFFICLWYLFTWLFSFWNDFFMNFYNVCLFVYLQLECSDHLRSLVSPSWHTKFYRDCSSLILEDRKYSLVHFMLWSMNWTIN